MLNFIKDAQYCTHVIVPLAGYYSYPLKKIEKDVKKSVFGRAKNDYWQITKDNNQKELRYDHDLNPSIFKLFGNDFLDKVLENKQYKGKTKKDKEQRINNLKDRIAFVYCICDAEIKAHCFDGDKGIYSMGTDPSCKKDQFEIDKVFLYVFNTGVAFLCLSFCYSNIGVMQKIYDPSYVRLKQTENATFFSKCSTKKFSFFNMINDILRGTRFKFFFDIEERTVFSDAYLASVAVISERIGDVEAFKRMVYNFHRMHALDYRGYTEDTINRSLFTFPNPKNSTYQWCMCVGDCSIARIRCVDSFERQKLDFRVNSMTLIILALYQKYSCLLFSQHLKHSLRKFRKSFGYLQHSMIDFKAFGVIPVSHVSRISNIRTFYKQVLDINGIIEATNELDQKLEVISKYDKDSSDSRINVIMIVLALFGSVSIISDMVSVVQLLYTGAEIERYTITITTTFLLLVFLIIPLLKNRNNK